MPRLWPRIPDHVRFKELAAGWQSIFIILGVIAGAGWALATRETQIARVAYEKGLAELRDQRVVNVEVKAASIVDSVTHTRLLVAVVELQNNGRTTEVVEGPQHALTISYVPPGNPLDDLDTIPVRLLEPASERTGKLRLMTGIKVRTVYVAPVRTPGLYYLRFRLKASEGEQKTARDDVARLKQKPDTLSWSWFDDAYVIVPGSTSRPTVRTATPRPTTPAR